MVWSCRIKTLQKWFFIYLIYTVYVFIFNEMISVLIVMECYAGLKYQSIFFIVKMCNNTFKCCCVQWPCAILFICIQLHSSHQLFYTSHACHVLDQQCQVGGCHKYCSFILAFRLDLPYLFHNCELLTFALGMLFELFVT